jgi:hypothetical protein
MIERFVMIYILHRAGVAPNLRPGANPSITRYNASVVNIYKATNSIERFSIKIIIPYCKNAPAYYIQRWRYCCKFRSRRIGSWNELTRPDSS